MLAYIGIGAVIVTEIIWLIVEIKKIQRSMKKLKTWIEREINCTIDFRKMFSESCVLTATAAVILAAVVAIWG